MTSREVDHRKLYDESWNAALEGGCQDFGDLELSMRFLTQSKLGENSCSILEIGCGTGRLCNSLYDMGYTNIVGVDISLSALAFGQNSFPHINLCSTHANSLAFRDNCFDVCLSFDLVEHMPDVKAHFKEVWGILKPGGKYQFQTPNILSNSLIETLRHRGLGWKVYHPSLQYPWGLKKKLLGTGFTAVNFMKLPPLTDYKIQQVPGFLRWAFKHIPWQGLPLFLQTNFYVIACK